MTSGATKTPLQFADNTQRDMPAQAADVAPLSAAAETAVNLAGELDAPIVFVNVRHGPAGFAGAHRGGGSLNSRTPEGKAA